MVGGWDFLTFSFHPFGTFWPILGGIPWVEHILLVISWNPPRNFLYILYNSSKYNILDNFRMLQAINFIFTPSNVIETINVLSQFGHIWVTWCHMTSLLRIWWFFVFLANFGAKIDHFSYTSLKPPKDMWKSTVLASRKSKNN